MAAGVQATPLVAETTWLENITHIDSRDLGGGKKTLLLTLANGHRYAIPIIGQSGEAIRRAVSPVTIAGSLPNNGHGA